jgi:hypothetical protein
MNQGVRRNHWLLIRLDGHGVGARVSVRTGARVQVREMKAGDSYASSSDPRAHFGLGEAARVDEIVVRWPSGTTTKLTGVEADRLLSIKE